MPILYDLLSLGMNGLHPIEPETMSLKELKNSIHERICLIGNVSVDVLGHGSSAEIEAEVRRCMEEGGRRGYMITSSNSIPYYASPENVLAMAAAIRQINMLQ
jgi:uroporphyrinogen-III decarboxylase